MSKDLNPQRTAHSFPRWGLWLGVVLFFGIPFVLQTSFFPLYRFGMFAEIPQHTPQKEWFFIRQGEQNWSPESIRMPMSVFQQLARNHHYRKDSQGFIQKIRSTETLNGTGSFWKVTFDKNQRDTTLLFREVQ